MLHHKLKHNVHHTSGGVTVGGTAEASFTTAAPKLDRGTLRARLLDGASTREIATEFGCSHSTVYRRQSAWKLTLDDLGLTRRSGPHRAELDRDYVLARFAEGARAHQVASDCGVTTGTVYARLREWGFPGGPPAPGVKKKPPPKVPVDIPKEYVLWRLINGVTPQEVANEVGVHPGTLEKRLGEWGYRQRDLRAAGYLAPGRRPASDGHDWVSLARQGVSANKIAAQYGAGAQTVREYLREHAPDVELGRRKRKQIDTEAARERWLAGETQQEIADSFGMTQARLSDLFVAAGYRSMNRKKKKKKITP